MVRTGSLFSQVLRELPRVEFERLIRRHGAERGAKGFTCWNQLVSMLFCHLAAADSLREICNGLACCLGKLVHLGVSRMPKKSTLSYANANRPAELYEDFLWVVLHRFRSAGHFSGKRHRFRFKNKLFSMDSTTISLCLSVFPWARFRRAKGGVKVHVLLDHGDYMPAFVAISEAKRHDVKVARSLRLNPGSIVAMDRAYNDYRMFSRWTNSGIHFVTRMKRNALYEVVEARAVPKRRNILSDDIIRLTGVDASKKCPHLLRRIVVDDPERSREIVLLTNHLEFGATTVAEIYRDRWQIELFFKALKQNLKIKTFIGTTENALRIQIWTALLALVLLKWLHHLSRASWSFSNLASLLRLNLFTYRNLKDWLLHPLGTPPLSPALTQLPLPIR